MERMHGTVTPKNIDSLFLLTGDATEGKREGGRNATTTNPNPARMPSTSTMEAKISRRLPKGQCLSCTEQSDRSLHAHSYVTLNTGLSGTDLVKDVSLFIAFFS